MLSHGSHHAESDDEDQGTYPRSHFAMIAMLRTTADDPESLAALHKQDEDLPPLESWSPEPSVPINHQSEPADPQLTVNECDAPSNYLAGLKKTLHPSPSLFLPGRCNLLEVVDQSDKFASMRGVEADVHYPFASHAEWQLARWLGTASLSQSKINKFL